MSPDGDAINPLFARQGIGSQVSLNDNKLMGLPTFITHVKCDRACRYGGAICTDEPLSQFHIHGRTLGVGLVDDLEGCIHSILVMAPEVAEEYVLAGREIKDAASRLARSQLALRDAAVDHSSLRLVHLAPPAGR